MSLTAAACIHGVELPGALLDALDEARQERLCFVDTWTDHTELAQMLATTWTTYRRVVRVTPHDRLPYIDDARTLSALRQHVRARLRADALEARAAYEAGEVERLGRAIDALHTGVNGLNALAPKSASLGAAAARKPRRHKRGKARKKLKGLPRDWDIQLLRAAPKDDRPWIAALSLTGARPGVLEASGIYVRVAGEHLLLTVPGSKGGAWVLLTYRLGEHKVADAMAAYVTARGGALHLRKSYNSAKKRHERITRNALGRSLPLTVHRHQLHADLKADGLRPETIALATGKTSTAGITVYATAGQGRSGRGLALHHVRSLDEPSEPELDGGMEPRVLPPPPPSDEPVPGRPVPA